MAKPIRVKNDRQKTVVDIYTQMLRSGRHSRWTIWADFVTLTACSLSVVDMEQKEKRAQTYSDVAAKYSEEEVTLFSEMLREVVLGLEENPDQDFLGELFMLLELSNDHNGQFFTPYNVCTMMAKMQVGELQTQIEQRGHISVNDCACGAGALLIAFANEAKRQGVNYQTHIEFVAQDIDFIAAMMCYIQLSLLGCPGYVIVGDTIRTPPTEPLRNQNVWYTPMYFRDVWHWRRVIKMFANCGSSIQSKEEQKKELEAALQVAKNGQLTLF